MNIILKSIIIPLITNTVINSNNTVVPKYLLRLSNLPYIYDPIKPNRIPTIVEVIMLAKTL